MTWKAEFDKGVTCFKRGELEQALVHMNRAAGLENNAFIIYDSRAAVHEKLGNLKAALLDSKRVIDLASDRWQGYARSARLFDLLRKYGSAIKMADHALGRLKPEDVGRRMQLVELREKAVVVQAAAEKQRLSQAALTSYLLGKLPVEILVQIFTLLVDVDHIWAIRLSHVCGHWRRILITTPSVWHTLVLSRKHPLRKAKLWKERSKNRIAHLSAAMSQLDTTPVFAELRDLCWDHLSSLRISSTAFIELYDTLRDISIPCRFSELRELALLEYGLPDSVQSSRCLSGPNWRLRTLYISGVIDMKEEWWKRIRELKELHLAGTLAHFSIQVLTANPSLEKLILDCPMIQDADLRLDDNNPFVAMNHLKSVECHSIRNPFPIMSTIVAPSITHFSISSIAMITSETLFHIASRPSLVELHIDSCTLDLSTLPTLLPLTPNLETLRLNTVQGVVNEMFQFLTSKAVDSLHGLPCRALKHVDVSSCSDLTTSSVFAFVKTRAHYASESVDPAEKCAVIASLKVDGCPNIEPEVLPWFRSKVAQFSCAYATKKGFRKDRRRYA